MNALLSTSLRPRVAFVIVWALSLLLAAGCRSYRTREFVATEYPVKFESPPVPRNCAPTSP
jgi:hypothetical protein